MKVRHISLSRNVGTLRNIPEERRSQTLWSFDLCASIKFSCHSKVNLKCNVTLQTPTRLHVDRNVVKYEKKPTPFLLFQNNYQQDDTYRLSFISGLVVLHSTFFELQGAHHQEFTFLLYRQPLAYCVL